MMGMADSAACWLTMCCLRCSHFQSQPCLMTHSGNGGVYVEALMNARDLSDPKLTRAKPPSDYAALPIECAWLCWQEARQELKR